jgi:multidrug efflux system membrane fusion protein
MIQHIQEAIDARVGQENSLVAQVEAELAEARLNLEYSTIHAPCDGVITNLQLREGDFAHVGEAVLSCVDRGNWMVVANYREWSLERLQTGQRALVTFRAAPGRIYRARILALGWGVNQGQGVPSGNLPEVARLQTWVPPSQRFQVRLVLDDPAAAPLRVGTTCTVTTIADPASPIVPLTRFIHRFVSLWCYF